MMHACSKDFTTMYPRKRDCDCLYTGNVNTDNCVNTAIKILTKLTSCINRSALQLAHNDKLL